MIAGKKHVKSFHIIWNIINNFLAASFTDKF